MKAVIYSICIGTLALAVTAWGEQNDWRAKANAKGAKASHSAAVQNVGTRSYGHASSNVGQVNTRHSFSTGTQFHQPTYTANRSAIVRQYTTTNLNSNAGISVRNRNFRTSNELRTRNYVTTNRNRTLSAGAGSNVTFNRERNFNVNRDRNVNFGGGSNVTFNRERNFGVNRQGSVAVTNNWRGQQFSGQNYSAFRNYSRTYHDRYWWQSNYPRITFCFGAPYYWDTGYWYPAWGYYPDYVYEYDGPIYGYNDLAPDQVIVNVQAQLQQDGYYNGPIDGVLGPMTRAAVAQFQADHGLAITSTIDRPTLDTLGLS